MSERDSRDGGLARDRFRAIVEALPSAILMVDAEGAIQLANTKAEQLFGYSREELIGQKIELLVPERYLGRHREDRVNFLHHLTTWPMSAGRDLYCRRKDCTELPVEIGVSAMTTDEGIFVLASIIDITERKQLDEQLRQSQEMEAISRLAVGVAHDFNNLLTAINGYSSLALQRIDDNSSIKHYLEEVRKAGDRAANLTRQLLAFGRKQILQPVPLDLNNIVTDMNKMLRRLIGEDIELTAKLSPDLKKIKADPGQIEQVIVNLAVNARDAMPHGGKLTIETANVTLSDAYAALHVGAHAGNYVMLAVSDSGSGMDEATRARIFEPFFTTKERGKGTGLGLSTVYGIVQQSGGSIWVYSELNRGTSIKVYLPQLASEVDHAEEKEPTADQIEPHIPANARPQTPKVPINEKLQDAKTL